uniref:Polyprotein 1 n=1 Tax=Peony yellowing associated secovirus TaxID=2800952 RepID=A0A7L7QTW7_9SECO|nr:polyprotein 1 [Peony yellowing associated secovirus]
MGYSRGARGGADKPKLCGVCFASFPDVQERKAHYRKYNCRDSFGNLGGLVETGRCLKAKDANIEIMRGFEDLRRDDGTYEEIEAEYMSDLVSFSSLIPFSGIRFGNINQTTPLIGSSYPERIFRAPGYNIEEYTVFQAPRAGARDFLAPDRVHDADVLVKNARYAEVGKGFGSSSQDRTGLGGEDLKYRFDNDKLFSDLDKGLARFVSAGFTVSDFPVLRKTVPDLTAQDLSEMAQALSDDWVEWCFFEEDYEESLEELLDADFFYVEEVVPQVVPVMVEATRDLVLRNSAQETTLPIGKEEVSSPTSVLAAPETSCQWTSLDADILLDSASSYPREECWRYDSEDESFFPVAPLDKFHNKVHDISFIDYCDLDYQEKPEGCVRAETWFFDGCLPGPWFKRDVSLDEAVVCEKLPLIGKSPLELMVAHQIEPTGDLLLDIQRALYTYYRKEVLPHKRYFDLNGTPVMVVLEDWRADLRYCLYAPLVKGNQLKDLMSVINKPLPGWLLDFPQRRKTGILQASGWNPLRYFSKQATLGFLDGVMAKLRELLGPVINAATFVWDLVIKAKDYAFSMLEDMIEKRGELLRALLQPLLYVCGFLIFLGSLRGLKAIVEQLGIPLAILTGAAIGIGVYILVQFLGQAHMGALKRSTKIWELVQSWDKPSEVKLVDEQIIEVLVEESPDKEEWLRNLLASPQSIPECVIDITHMKDLLCSGSAGRSNALGTGAIEASSAGMLFGSSFIWKILLLLCPLSLFGVSTTLSCAKDLITIQGGQDAAGRFFQDLVGGTQEVFYTLTGSKSEFLDYIYATVGVDFQEWRTEVLELTTATPTSIFLGPQERLKRLRVCKDKADRLILQMDSRKVPGAYITHFNNLLQALDRALIECQQALSVGKWRKTPACIWLYGDSHVGKSVCSQYLIDDMLDSLDYAQTGRVFSRNGSDSFWSCYKNQSAVLYDDFGAVSEGGHFDEAEIIRLIAPAPLPLNMPNLEAKGNTCCTSDFVFITANQAGLTPAAVIHCKKAFENRRLIPAEVTAVEGGRYRDRYRFTLHQKNEPYPRDDRFQVMNYEQFLQYAVNQSRHHFSEQMDLRDAPHTQIYAAADQIAAEAEEGFRTAGIKIPFCMMKSLSGNQLTFFSEELYKEVTETLEQEDADIIRARLDPGVITQRFQMLLPKAAYVNLKNHFSLGTDPFEQPNPYFNCSQRAKVIGRFLKPKVTEEQLEAHKRGFVAITKELAQGACKAISSAPFLVKLLLGFGALYFIGLPILSWLKSLFSAPSMMTFAALGTMKASGSLSSSQDQETKRTATGRERRRYLLEASGAGAVEAKAQDVETELACLSKHLVGFTSMDFPDRHHRGIAVGGTRVLMVYHVWLEMQSGCYKVGSLTKTFPFTINRKNCSFQRLGLKDLVLVDFPPTFVSFPLLNLEKWLLSSHDPFMAGSGWFMEVLFHNNGVLEVAREEADYTLLDTNDAYDAAFLKGVGLNKCVRYTICDDSGTGYRNDFFYVSQCGTPLVANYGRGKGLRIASIHVVHHFSATEKDVIIAGSGSLITKEEYLEAALLLGDIKHPLETDRLQASGCLSGEEFFDAETVFPEGLLSPSEAPRQATSSEIRKSSISADLELLTGEKKKTEPAIICNRDPRLLDRNLDIFKKGMLKYKAVAAEMSPVTDEDTKIWDLTWDNIFDLPGGISQRCHLLSEDENLNGVAGDNKYRGMVVATSEGWPEVLNRPNGEVGKERFLLGLPGCYTLNKELPMYQRIVEMDDSCKTTIPCIVGLDTAKDERLPLSKIYQEVKTRLFTILPMEYNYLVRKYFGSFVAELMKLHNCIPTKVGINPLGYDWTILGKRMHAKGTNWFNGDYSRFDGVTPRCLLIEIARRITIAYGDDHGDKRLHLMLAATTRLGIAGRGWYRVSGGIPSGFALTVIVNSLVNHFLVRWSWEHMMASSSLFFFDCVELAVVGDDNLVSVKQEAAASFNLRTLSAFLKGFGFTLKDGSDKNKEELPDFNPPEKCDFLKRCFKAYGDRYLAPLAWMSLSESLHWVRETNMSNPVATQNNVEGFLRELFHYGDKQLYCKWRRDLLDLCAKNRVPHPTSYSFEELERSWLSGKAVASFFQKEEPEVVVIKNAASDITPNVHIVPVKKCLEWRSDEVPLLIWCGPNCPNQLKNASNCFVIRAPQGSRYPLRATVRGFLHKVHARGDNVYFSGALDQSLVHWVAAYYASMYRSSFNFSEYMRSFFGEDDKGLLAAVTAAKGW